MIGSTTTGSIQNLPDLTRPHCRRRHSRRPRRLAGYLGNEFVTAILEDRKPLVDIALALNMTVAGIVAHQSALKDGETMKIPQYRS